MRNSSGMKTPVASVGESSTGKLGDRVYDYILGQVMVGAFPVNRRLPAETELAERLGVSRPVVRQALERLRADGLIASRQGAGSFVLRRPAQDVYNYAPIESIADIQRCFAFRAALEGEMAALAARDWDAAAEAKMRQALSVLDAVISRGDLGAEEDMAFHRAVAEATGNRFFVTTLVSLQEQISTGIKLNRHLSLKQPRQRLITVQREHQEILSAIVSRDEAAARSAMRSHINNASRRIFEGE